MKIKFKAERTNLARSTEEGGDSLCLINFAMAKFTCCIFEDGLFEILRDEKKEKIHDFATRIILTINIILDYAKFIIIRNLKYFKIVTHLKFYFLYS